MERKHHETAACFAGLSKREKFHGHILNGDAQYHQHLLSVLVIIGLKMNYRLLSNRLISAAIIPKAII